MTGEGAFHGGEFWNALGPTFPEGFSESRVINADVLDAWFPPSPAVVELLSRHAEWLARTSPPTHAEGLRETIRDVRSLPLASIATGAGSSDLIYRILSRWIGAEARAQIPDPCYGEYSHLLEKVVGARVARFDSEWGMDLDEWDRELARGPYDLAVIVNPNNPTGEVLDAARLAELVKRHPRTTFWIDEAYMDYVEPTQTLEPVASSEANVVVVKSLSKGLALSGCRAAYLVAHPDRIEEIRRITPPWNVGTFAQLAAIRALEDPVYYRRRYRETATYRRCFTESLVEAGLQVRPGINWVMVGVPDAEVAVQAAKEAGLFVRHAGRTASCFGNGWIRIAVKDLPTQDRILKILTEVLSAGD